MSNESGFVRLDTSCFTQALKSKDRLISEYSSITTEFERIEKQLLSKWKGSGADAFQQDCNSVRTNLVGIGDILRTMCDTLEDCREVFYKCDQALKEYNVNPSEKKK